MKVINLRPHQSEVLDNFLSEIKTHSPNLRPMVFIGKDLDGHLVLHLMDMSWEELSHVKTSFEMHVIKDSLGML